MKIYLFVLFNLFYSVVYSQIQQDILISSNGNRPVVEIDKYNAVHILWSESYIKYVALDSVGNFLMDTINISNGIGAVEPSLTIKDSLVASV